MKKNIFIFSIICVFVFIIFVASSCPIAFTYTTDTSTIELPATNGAYVEGTINFPDDALKSGLTFNEITLHYTVRKNGSFAANVSLYASTDQTADNIKGSNDEKLIDVTLNLDDNQVSGSTISNKIKEALNNKQSKMVFGAENLSLNPLSSVYIDLKITFSGTYSAF